MAGVAAPASELILDNRNLILVGEVKRTSRRRIQGAAGTLRTNGSQVLFVDRSSQVEILSTHTTRLSLNDVTALYLRQYISFSTEKQQKIYIIPIELLSN